MQQALSFVTFDEGGIAKAIPNFLTDNSACLLEKPQTSVYESSTYTHVISRAADPNNSGCYFLSPLFAQNVTLSFKAKVQTLPIIDCFTSAINVLFYNTSTDCTGQADSTVNTCLTTNIGLCSTKPLYPAEKTIPIENIYSFNAINQSYQYANYHLDQPNSFNTVCALPPVYDIFDAHGTNTYIVNWKYEPFSDCYSINNETSAKVFADCNTGALNFSFYSNSAICTGNYTIASFNGCKSANQNTTDSINSLILAKAMCLSPDQASPNSSPSISIGAYIGIAVGATAFITLLIFAIRYIVRRRY